MIYFIFIPVGRMIKLIYLKKREQSTAKQPLLHVLHRYLEITHLLPAMRDL